MTTTDIPRVTELNHISLNGLQYKLRGPIQARTISPYPTGRDIGVVGSSDIPGRVRRIRWTSLQGGIGIKDLERDEDVFRLRYGTSHIRVNGHRTLPDRVTTTAASGVSGVITVGALEELASTVYASFATSIRSYTLASDTWSSNLQTMDGNATDSETGRLGGTVYMMFTTGTSLYYTTDGSSWTTITDNIQYLSIWDDRVWGIDSTGQLKWAFDPTGTWTDDAQLPLESDSVQDLLVYRDATGEPILYASTKRGLYAHDANNNRFVETEAKLPFHDDAGAGAVVWRGAMYIPAGLGVYEYRVGGDQATFRAMGPDRDAGLPSTRRGKIVRLESTHNDLIAIVDSTASTAASLSLFTSSGAASHMSPAMDSSTGRSLVLGWNGLGWDVKHETDASTEEITTSLVSNAYNQYLFMFGHNRRVSYFTLPVDVINPDEITDREYADASRDDLPWFNAGRADVAKLAIRLNVEVAGMSSAETVTPFIYLNYDDDDGNATALTALTEDGIHTYHFPATTSGSVARTSVGTAFRSIFFRTDLANGANNSLSPDVRSMELEYREKLDAASRNTWGVEIDLSENVDGRTPKEMRAEIEAIKAQNLFVEFTYRDDDDDVRNFAVEVADADSTEFTGRDERGNIALIVTQV